MNKKISGFISLAWDLILNRILRKIWKMLVKHKIRVHSNAASDGSEMEKWINMVWKYSSIEIKNMFEIGANYGQDAEFFCKYAGLKQENIYVFEPHPQLFVHIKNFYKFKSFEYAISNEDCLSQFHAIDLTKNSNSGISSLLKHNYINENDYIDVTVSKMRMDTFIEKFKIDDIDFIKLDVEGCTFQVLEGFGKYLSSVKCFQLEAEHIEVFNGEKLFDEVSQLLIKNGFKMIHFHMLDEKQSDSLWIQERFLKA